MKVETTTGYTLSEIDLIRKLELYLKLGGKDAKIFKSVYKLEKPYRLSSTETVKAFSSLSDLEMFIYSMIEHDE